MKYSNDWLLYVFWTALGALAFVFAFYVASILIPVLLFVVLVSGFLSLLFSAQKKNASSKKEKIVFRSSNRADKNNIIDAEYEVIDDSK